MNSVVIDEVPKFLTSVPSDTMHAIQIMSSFGAIHLIIIPLHLSRVASYFDVKKGSGYPQDRTHGESFTEHVELQEMVCHPYCSSRGKITHQLCHIVCL